MGQNLEYQIIFNPIINYEIRKSNIIILLFPNKYIYIIKLILLLMLMGFQERFLEYRMLVLRNTWLIVESSQAQLGDWTYIIVKVTKLV